ncbi:MAG: hypothetical protein KDK37_01060 [Leptospiraceae bacterium]|nr:hypothetical protein [Leptospiraceae bacterium]MCB1302832.1 hypothetical protein [Leptospiraceae bacterium]
MIRWYVVGLLKQSKFPLLILLAIHCGNYNPDQSGQGPTFRPEVDLVGNFYGRQIIYDRNDSIVETATIDRSCELVDGPAISCALQIRYERENRNEQLHRRYDLKYREAFDATIQLHSEREDASGKIHGAAFHLKGEGKVPNSNEPVTEEVRFIALSGGESLETILYSYWGMHAGKSVTFWRRQ